jgi:NADH-quinone oxidoreductase subunit N
MTFVVQFLPELVLLAGALGLFVVTLGASQQKLARTVALLVGFATLAAAAASLHQQGELFSGAYRVDQFSQLIKLILAFGFVCILVLNGELPDIRDEVKPEYYLFLTLSVTGLVTLVSSVEIISIVVALELSSFPLYLLVPMRRERAEQKSQMESAIKYIMFGVAANGIMFFGLSYLYGLTGTTNLLVMSARLLPVVQSPLAIAGLGLAFCGLYYKLAIFPFHFWSPDVYQGASNETASLVASLPKVGAVVVLIRFVSLASPANPTVATMLTGLAVSSMFFGNLVALVQKDFKRLLGFSAIAHAGYALMGFVAMNQAGYTAAVYYITGYLLMVLACFVVICRVSRDGTNVAIEELAGLHRRSPLLAATLLVAVFALAGVPPFVGFMGKFSLLTAAYGQGHLTLVVIAVINSSIAIYYYLQVVRQAVFGDPTGDQSPIVLAWPARALCVVLIVGIVALGVAPGAVLDTISSSLAFVTQAGPATAFLGP